MYIDRLHLTNFRNYTDAGFDFSTGINLIVGNNGRGKSNLVEAVFLLSTSKSFRGAYDRQMMRWEADRYCVQGWFVRGEEEFDLTVDSDGRSKRLFINGNAEDRVSSIIGLTYCVLLCAEDSTLITGPPSRRRNFLDLVLSTVDPLYFSNLRTYFKIVRQKNSTLRSGAGDLDMLAVWNEQLIPAGSYIMRRRAELTAFMNEAIDEIIEGTGMEEPVQVCYRPNVRFGQNVTLEQRFHDELEKAMQREQSLGQCVAGPHRDEMTVHRGEMNLRLYGSAGQARMGSILLKLTQASFFRKKKETLPILILDDILPELDMTNRERVIGLLGVEHQILLTATSAGQVPETVPIEQVLNI